MEERRREEKMEGEREREERKSEGRNAGADGEVGRYLGT